MHGEYGGIRLAKVCILEVNQEGQRTVAVIAGERTVVALGGVGEGQWK